MRLVIIESPYAAGRGHTIEEHVTYARRCIRDCLLRGESPIASHLLFTQPGVLEDANPEERELGMEAGWSWLHKADAVVVYEDYGISLGMRAGMTKAAKRNVAIEHRTIGK